MHQTPFMTRWLFVFALPLFTSISVLAQQTPNVVLVPVTANENPTLRLQFTKQNDSVLVYGTNMGVMPVAMKKMKLANPKVKFNYSHALQMAEASLESNYALQRDTSMGFRTKLTGQSYYTVLKGSFLEGKGSAPIFINQWIRLGGFIAPATWPTNFSATVADAGTYTVNYLPAAAVNALPVLDEWKCEKAEPRFVQLRAQQGYGVEKLTYKNYNAQRRQTIKKSFDLFFESNSVQPKSAELKAVTDYLDQNKFEILNAVMEGGSSVEGDPERNKKLQRDRAKIIAAALSKYNKSAIKKDTILLSDNWPRFREQLKASNFAWLDTLSNDEILKAINTNDKVRKGLEPVLKTQRKASLNLNVAKVLNADDQFVTLQKSLNGWLKNLLTSKQPGKDLEPQIMGGLAWMFEQHVNGELSSEEMDSLLFGPYLSHKYMYVGLHIIKQFNTGKFGEPDSAKWRDLWDKFELGSWFTKAQTSLVALADASPNRTEAAKYLKMQADFQSLAYSLISMKVLAPDFLCHHVYPDKPEYMGLLLNQQAFLYELSNERGWTSECGSNRETLTGVKAELFEYASDSSKTVEAPLAITHLDTTFMEIGTGLEKVGFPNRVYTKPSYHVEPKGVYYFLLKQGFVKGNKAIVGNVDGNVSLDAYALFHFLEANISQWKPEQNYFFDREVRLEEMERLMAQMKKDRTVCAPMLSDLFLTYHRKALVYLNAYFEPGSAKHKEIAESSLKYITEYYKKRVKSLPANVPVKVALFLNQFNWFSGANEGAWYGFDFMNALVKARKLNDQELKLWAQYLKTFDPAGKNPLPGGYTKEMLSGLQGF